MTDDVHDFRIAVPAEDVDELHRRLRHTRWPDREPVDDWSQGVPLAVVQAWCRAWLDHDWYATERRLNRIPQVTTVVDGVRLHALHVRSSRPDATPVVLTHGWPGSFLEFEGALDALAEPPADEPAFHVVVPSVPGYGFSGRPVTTGWTIHRIAGAWIALMARLGYERFERAALAETAARSRTASAYSEVHRTRPQTLGYALTDSPAGLAAWLGEKLWTWADRASGGLRTDQVLDDLSLYWFTGTAASSSRLYWESIAEVGAWITDGTRDTVTVRTGCSVFPAEVPRPSRRWAEQRFTRIVHWGEPARGGHFAAWEQPELFVAELRATRRALG